MNKHKKRQEIMSAVLGVYAALVLWITILGRHTTVDNTMLFSPFHSIISIISDIKRNGLGGNIIGNILLFIPVGFLAPFTVRRMRLRLIIFIGFLSSLIIEICQLVTAKGYFEIDDIILNTLGTAIGYGLYKLVVSRKLLNSAGYETMMDT